MPYTQFTEQCFTFLPITWDAFKEKVTQCNERGMLYQEMGMVNFFFLEHVINFEGLVILKFIGKVCQTIPLQGILAQYLY